jgi:hypothetical protein
VPRTASVGIRRQAGTNAPVTIDGDYVIVGAANALSKGQQPLIIACKLGVNGELPHTVQ